MNLHGKEADVDVMIEAKCTERTLLKFRDETMRQPNYGQPAEPTAADLATELASKFL